ncbi:hypothetical protein AAVH_34245 [Aphelenchoides avenae]|nr:hypothetical protein AAVH_34245 [Aphelenchus avenae]
MQVPSNRPNLARTEVAHATTQPRLPEQAQVMRLRRPNLAEALARPLTVVTAQEATVLRVQLGQAQMAIPVGQEEVEQRRQSAEADLVLHLQLALVAMLRLKGRAADPVWPLMVAHAAPEQAVLRLKQANQTRMMDPWIKRRWRYDSSRWRWVRFRCDFCFRFKWRCYNWRIGWRVRFRRILTDAIRLWNRWWRIGSNRRLGNYSIWWTWLWRQ